MPQDLQPMTVRRAMELLQQADPDALVVLPIKPHYGIDGLGGIFRGFVKASGSHRNMQWSPDAAKDYIPAVMLEPIEKG